MAIVLLDGLCWLKPETSLAEMGSRPEAVECLCWKPCLEVRVPSASTIDGKRNRSNIFNAWQNSEVSWFPCLQNRDYDGVLPNCRRCQLRQMRGWRALSGRPGRAHQECRGEACKPVMSLGGAVEEPALLMAAATALLSNSLWEGSTLWWPWRSLISLLSARSCWAEQAVNCLLKARAIAFELDWVFPWRRLRCLVGTRSLVAQLAQEGPVALGVGGTVGGLQKGHSLVLSFLANVPLDFSFQHLDGRVEGVVGAALISL